MSNNHNNQRNRNNQNNADDADRIRGPTSALSSFLREHGIRVENRSRQQMMERRRQQRQNEAAAAATNSDPAATPTATDASTAPATPSESTPIETILYTPRSRRRGRSAQDQAIMDAAINNTSKKKKRPLKDEENSDISSDEYTPQPSSSRAPAGRIRVLFCTRCKCRFVRNNSDPSEETMCPNCVAGKEPTTDTKTPKKRNVAGTKKAWYMHGVDTCTVPSLQDICIQVVTDHIDDVEALGDISVMNMDKIAKIISRNRQLVNRTARLFMQPQNRQLDLYDCTNVDVTGLKNIAHFCPNLKTLRLYYCGRMTDEVLELYGTHLKHLTSITLTGCHMITEERWIDFFKTMGDRLEGFSLRHSNRFKRDSMKALVTNCTRLKHLELCRVVTLSDDWVDMLVQSGIDGLETLELGYPSTDPAHSYTITPQPLIKLLELNGGSLKELSLRGCCDITDELLIDGILPYCTRLQKLVLDGCDRITSGAFTSLFSDDWKLQPNTIHRQPVVGLRHVIVNRCLKFDDNALNALLEHSGTALTHLGLHSLEKLTAKGLESIAGDDPLENKDTRYSEINKHKRVKTAHPTPPLGVGSALVHLDTSFVRAMDDLVLAKVIRTCTNLKHIKLWGCHQISDSIKAPRQVIIEGREFS